MSSATDTRFDSKGAPVTIGANAPSSRVIRAMESGLVGITRRAEIFEYDGVTPWQPPNSSDEVPAKLIDGNISVDYNSDERRKLEVTFENIDNLLRPSPYEGFWYDKVIKIWRGVEVDRRLTLSSGLIMESQNADRLRNQLGAAGLANVDIMDSETKLTGYDYYIVEPGLVDTIYASQLNRLWQLGKKIITIGVGTTKTTGAVDGIPLYSTMATSAGASWGLSQPGTDTPTVGAFGTQTHSSGIGGQRATGLLPGVTALSVWPSGTPTTTSAAIGFSQAGGIWLDIRLPDLTKTEPPKLLASVIKYMEREGSDTSWEVQVGEFLIDRIDIDSFPNTVKVTGRDYTKRLMGTRLKYTSTFAVGTPLRTLITAVAANGGIAANKMRFSINEADFLASEMTYEKGTDRWSIIKESCAAYNYEVYFDAMGYLVVRPFRDPSTTPVSWAFNTGPTGNLVKYARSTNDSRLYNHVIVYGEPQDGQLSALPYFGEAEITDVTSPVHPDRIGDRIMPPITTNYLSSDADAQAMAERILKVSALESYELSFESIVYPWLEVGEIVDIADPDATQVEPTRFLMDTLTVPLGLGSMSATGKRVTFVGSSG